MREKKLITFHCPEEEHNVRVSCLSQLDHTKRRVLSQKIVHCSYKTDNLCKIELYPPEGTSKCPAVTLANRQQFK